MSLTVISSLSLSGKRVLSLLVLGNLVRGVLSALLSFTVWMLVESVEGRRVTYRFVGS